LELTIEKLVYGGDGLARIESPNGKRKTIFVPLVLAGEQIEASIVEERPGFARARLEKILAPAAERVEPPCPYFGDCGGCHYQHVNYDSQLKFKAQILRETVNRIAKIELPDVVTHASPPLNYRNRTRMKLERHGSEFVLGYYRLGSHQLLPIQQCPISSPAINRALNAIWVLSGVHELPASLAEIEFFSNHDDTAVLLEFGTDNGNPSKLTRFANAIHERDGEVIGAAAIRGRLTTDEAVAAPELSGGPTKEAAPLFGERSFTYRVGKFQYTIGPDAFFQTNRFLIPKLVDLVTNDAEGKLALDLYAGAGLFTQPVAQQFDRVVAVESSSASVRYLHLNVPPHAKVVESSTEAYVERGGQKPDYIIVDPPRAGLGKRVVAGLARLAPKKITYVSCDPSTLARDLPGLIAAGYKIRQAHLVDLFPQTFHIETVLRLER
jgi:23S rRNA (uracil1939-C5)-methyltransferase